MKIKSLLLTWMIGAGLALACEKTPEPEEIPAQSGYTGTLSVVEIGDALFTMNDVRADYRLDEDGRLDLYFYDVTFSSQMPVKLSVLMLPDVAYRRDGATLSLSDSDIVPLMEMRGEMIPYERYLCTGLSGTLTPAALTLSMRLGGFQTDYSGRAEP